MKPRRVGVADSLRRFHLIAHVGDWYLFHVGTGDGGRRVLITDRFIRSVAEAGCAPVWLDERSAVFVDDNGGFLPVCCGGPLGGRSFVASSVVDCLKVAGRFGMTVRLARTGESLDVTLAA